MKNGSTSVIKRSKNQKQLNYFVAMSMAIQLLAALIGSSILTIWTEYEGDEYVYLWPFMKNNDTNMMAQGFLNIGVWFIAIMNFVPISLLISVEMINFIQAKFIAWDMMVYDEARDLPALVQSSNLNEELGMVHYIFSDKTGTLTQNIMEFQKCTVDRHKFGDDSPQGVEYLPGVTNVNFYDEEMTNQLQDKRHPNHTNVKNFLEALGLCHTIITDIKVDKETQQEYTIYNASSPDELALVNGARHLGFTFESRDDQGNMVCQTWDGERRYKLLNVIEFDSTRKRMSVIVKTPDNRILVICKGADSIIEKRLKPDQHHLAETKEYLDEFAQTGLRTLLVASKEISESHYLEWRGHYLKASTSMYKDREMAKLQEELEVDFNLIGSTAIEDKLQEDVAQTIYDIRQAGIKVWVLTGDKIETAMNIGYACKLLEQQMNTFILSALTPSEVHDEISEAYLQQGDTFKKRENAVVIAGETLALIQLDKALETKLVDLCERANVVLACRVSPKQKAEVVHLIKNRNP